MAISASTALQVHHATSTGWVVGLVLTALLTGALAMGVASWMLMRRNKNGRDARYREVLEQSPNGMLLADVVTLRVFDANPALQQSFGYALEELRGLTLPQLFLDDSNDPDHLSTKLLGLDPRVPLRLRQRCRDGSEPEVEALGHRLILQGHNVLALTTYDVSLRRKIEAQLLEKQQHLDHLAHHDQLTGLPNRLYLAHHLPDAINEASPQRHYAGGAVSGSRPLQAHQ